MKIREVFLSKAVAQAVLFASFCHVEAVVFASDTVVTPLDTTHDSAAAVTSKCVLKADGPHGFASVQIASGGTLTHTAGDSGELSITASITNEVQTLDVTNAVPLASSNVLTAAQRSSSICPPPVERIGIKHGILQ